MGSIKSIKSDIHYPNKKRRLDKDKLSKERHETMLTTKLVKPKSKMRSSLYHLSIDDSKLTILTQPDEHINTKKESMKKKKMESEKSTKTKTDKPPPLPPHIMRKKSMQRRRKGKGYSSLCAL